MQALLSDAFGLPKKAHLGGACWRGEMQSDADQIEFYRLDKDEGEKEKAGEREKKRKANFFRKREEE